MYRALTRAHKQNVATSNRKHTHARTQREIEAAVTAMRRHAENAKVQEEGCRALWNLAVNNENLAKIGAQVDNTHENM